MPRAISIHLGVNDPQQCEGQKLQHSEATAWRMAGLAAQAGYQALRVLRGPEAMRQALRRELEAAAGALCAGDILFVSFSGHGALQRNLACGEHGWDEAWCLHDGILLDDELADWWRRFRRGVRILVVAECCYAGGNARDALIPPPFAAWPGTWPGTVMVTRDAPAMKAPCDSERIEASVLLLVACGEKEQARDGLFTQHLLELWGNGAFTGSYVDLLHLLRQRLLPVQNPDLQMIGTPDLPFANGTAFHVDLTPELQASSATEVQREPPPGFGQPWGAQGRGG